MERATLLLKHSGRCSVENNSPCQHQYCRKEIAFDIPKSAIFLSKKWQAMLKPSHMAPISMENAVIPLYDDPYFAVMELAEWMNYNFTEPRSMEAYVEGLILADKYDIPKYQFMNQREVERGLSNYIQHATNHRSVVRSVHIQLIQKICSRFIDIGCHWKVWTTSLRNLITKCIVKDFTFYGKFFENIIATGVGQSIILDVMEDLRNNFKDE